MKDLLDLYLAFFKIGMVNFGGGYAMLPLLEEELVKKKHWTSMDELMDYFAIGQCTPGVIALNVSTFIGHKKKGTAGAIASTIGFLSAPIVIILLIASFLTNFADLPIVKNAFAGIRVCVCILIIQAILRLWKKAVVDKMALALYLVIFFLAAFSKQLPISLPAAGLVIMAGIFGIFFRREQNGTGESESKAGTGGSENKPDQGGSKTDEGESKADKGGNKPYEGNKKLSESETEKRGTEREDAGK